MKKVIFGLAVVAAAAFGAYNANKADAKAQLSDLQMENVEALGNGGEFGFHGCNKRKPGTCPNGETGHPWFVGIVVYY